VEDGLRAVTFVAAPTAAMLSELIRLYGLRGPFTVIPNGRREPATALPKEPFVLAAGRLWDEAKNLGALDRAAAGLDWPVVVAGAGEAQRPEHTHLLGQLPEQKLLEWMGRASIFAAPARYEPFGLAALEAGLAGCALVLGDIPSLREVWGDAALYVNPLDDEELALTLARLIDDEDLCGSRGAAARAHARRYSPERMAAGYLDVYEQLATEATAEPEGFVALR
jgi:glycosyltransferase involved in cell wall biosynthesis